MSGLKKNITDALALNHLSVVAQSASRDRKVISTLLRLSYDKDTLVGWRAILAVGLAARELVRTDAEFLRDTCRKLLWSLNDESGGIGWSAPELLGEIVSADPKRFADIIPLIAEAYAIEGGMFKAGVVYALARIGAQSPEPVASYQAIMDDALADRDPMVRIRALELVQVLFGRADRSAVWTNDYAATLKGRIERMAKGDKGEASIYTGSDFSSFLVEEQACSVINNL